jgi:single-stranded-DNA-specific exonuclease
MPAVVCWARSWHPGLIGLLAGKIAEKYQRPAIVLALNDDGFAKGSCRSTKTINILDVLKHKDVIDNYSKKLDGTPIIGGHAFAAGMEVPEGKLEAFRSAVCDVLSTLNPDYTPGKKVYFADSKMVHGEINDTVFEKLQGLAPFGSGHPDPVFWVKDLLVSEQKYLSNEKHLKLTLVSDKLKYKRVSALLWHRAGDYKGDYVDKKIDVLFTFGKESKSYGSKFFMQIVDMKLSEPK